jgi:hypothetical protein
MVSVADAVLSARIRQAMLRLAPGAIDATDCVDDCGLSNRIELDGLKLTATE